MARGRKGPPQESIDSILLAMSRRDDIDPDTLSHYFDRLDEEWTDGARDKVLHLLRTNDPKAHSAAILILSELATDFDLEELEDFVADPTVSDLAKLTLAPVLKELDSDMADDGIIDYLNDPEAAMLQMQMRLLELVGQSELGVESVLEDVVDMPMDRRLGFINWLGSSQDPRAANLLIPLLENQASKVVTATIDALEQLGPVASNQSIPALNYLLATSSNRQLKQQARAVLGRLTMHSTPGTEDAAMDEARQHQLPLYEARASFIDGSGTQMVMLAWQRPDGLLKGVNVLYQDEWGIKDCYGTDEMEVERWTELVDSMDEQGFGSFHISLEYSYALISEARAVNKRTRHKLPVAYAVWRPLIEGGMLQKNAPALSIMLEPRPFNSEVEQLAQHGDELYQLTEFDSWYFDPFDSVKPYINPYLMSKSSSSSSRSRRRKGGQRAEEDQKAKQEALVTEALEKVIDNKWRLLYEARLRRQGALFQIVGRTKDAELVSAAASALHPDSGLPPQEQPFLRAMMHHTLENGFVRLMAEAMETGPFRSPLNFLSDDDDFYF
jgi:HEAT repeats